MRGVSKGPSSRDLKAVTEEVWGRRGWQCRSPEEALRQIQACQGTGEVRQARGLVWLGQVTRVLGDGQERGGAGPMTRSC